MTGVEKENGDVSWLDRLPAWLIGLVVAAALFALGLIVFQALGYGDNPVMDTGALSPHLMMTG